MNKKLGIFSAVLVTISTILFAIGIITQYSSMSYFVCLFLSWGYILLTCSFLADTPDNKKAIIYGSVAFACLYGVLVNVVYFTQLSTVAYLDMSSELKSLLSYETIGGFMFNIDLLGYGMMSVSIFLLGLTLTADNKVDKWLKILSLIHGVFVISCIFAPMANIFNSNMGDSGSAIGPYILLFWCGYFTPIGILSAMHFIREKNM